MCTLLSKIAFVNSRSELSISSAQTICHIPKPAGWSLFLHLVNLMSTQAFHGHTLTHAVTYDTLCEWMGGTPLTFRAALGRNQMNIELWGCQDVEETFRIFSSCENGLSEGFYSFVAWYLEVVEMFVSNGLRNVDAFVNFAWEHDMFDLEKVHPSTVAKWKLWSYEETSVQKSL